MDRSFKQTIHVHTFHVHANCTRQYKYIQYNIHMYVHDGFLWVPWGLFSVIGQHIHTREDSQWHTPWLSGRTAQHPGDSPRSGSAGPAAGSPPYQPQVPPARHRYPTGFGTGNINGNGNIFHSM